MATKMVTVKKNVCDRCGHVWAPRLEVTYICPVCKTAKWNAGKRK